MKYAICNELYGDWPFEKAFAHAAALGYTGVEIAPFTIRSNAFEIPADQRRQIRDLADANDLQVIGLHWLLAKTEGYHLTHDDPEIRRQTGIYLCELARLCRDLGGEIMVFGSPPQRNLANGVSDQQGFDRAVEVFRSISETLEQCGVVMALEPLGPEEGNFMLTAESAIAIAEAVDSPNVKLHLDVKAMSTEAKSIPEIIQDSRDWLVHFHANDPNRRGPGMGDVDFVPIFAALANAQYDGWISVEVFDYQPGVDALAGDSIRYMRQINGESERTQDGS
jgi:sugar phosphate isomerase/epimerase